MTTLTKLSLSVGAMNSATLGNLNVLSINPKSEDGSDIELKTSINHVLVYDRSGSMSGQLKGLVKDIQKAVSCLDGADIATIFWYSGSNQSGIVLSSKVSEINEADLTAALEKASSTVGLTVFSETLVAIEKLAESTELPLAISWFTDGYVCPNTGSSEQEKTRVMESIVRLNAHPMVVGINTIGYGNYYDKDLLVAMSAGSTIGSFNHSAELSDYSVIFNEFKVQASGAMPSTNISVKSDSDVIFLATTKSMKRVKLTEASGDAKLPYKFSLHNLPASGARIISTGNIEAITADIDESIEVVTTPRTINPASKVKSLYGMAAALYATNNREDALDIVENELGDQPLYSAMMTAYTVEEVGNAYAQMVKAFKDASVRAFNTITFENTYRTDVFTILTMLKSADASIVMNDAIAQYKRVGIKAEESQDEDTPMFKEIKDGSALQTATSNLSFSNTQFSVSIGNIVVPGTLTLKTEDRLLFADAVNGELPVSRIKTYSLIKDGALNMPFIDVTFENQLEATTMLERMKADGVTVEKVVVANVPAFRINLVGLPFANRTLSRAYTTFSELAPKIEANINMKMKKKVVNYFLKDVDARSSKAAKVPSAKKFTAVQLDALKETYSVAIYPYGLVYQGFKRPSVTDGDFDVYFTRFMEFGMKGFSSLPKVEECIDYAPAGARTSASKLAMKAVIDEVVAEVKATAKINLLAEKIERPTEALKVLTDMLDKLNRNSSDDLLEQIKFIKGTTSGFFSDLELPEGEGKKTYEVESNGNVYTLTTSLRKEYVSA